MLPACGVAQVDRRACSTTPAADSQTLHPALVLARPRPELITATDGPNTGTAASVDGRCLSQSSRPLWSRVCYSRGLPATTAASVSGFGWRGSSPRHRPRRLLRGSQLASGTPLRAGALPLSENADMSMISKSRWRGGAYRGYRSYRGGYRGYRGGYRGYRGVRAYGYRYGYRPYRYGYRYRPYRRYGAVGAAGYYGGYSYSGVCRPSGGYYGDRGVYGPRVYRGRGYAYRGYRGGYRGCTGDGRSPCGADTAGASPTAEDRQRLLSQASFEPPLL